MILFIWLKKPLENSLKVLKLVAFKSKNFLEGIISSLLGKKLDSNPKIIEGKTSGDFFLLFIISLPPINVISKKYEC